MFTLATLPFTALPEETLPITILPEVIVPEVIVPAGIFAAGIAVGAMSVRPMSPGASLPADAMALAVRDVNLFAAVLPAAGGDFSLRTRGISTLMFELQNDREEHRP